MKKVLCALLAAASLALCAGCSRPDAQTLDLLQGYGNQAAPPERQFLPEGAAH